MDYAVEWRKWREANHMSQLDMALAMGLGRSGGRKTVWNVENGKTRPSYSSQRKFESLKRRYANAARIGN